MARRLEHSDRAYVLETAASYGRVSKELAADPRIKEATL